MSVECANDGSAWALRVGPGAAMSQDPHVGYPRGPGGRDPDLRRAVLPDPGREAGRAVPWLGRGPVLRDRRRERGLHRLVLGLRRTAPPPGTSPPTPARPSPRRATSGAITHPQAASFLSPRPAGWPAARPSTRPRPRARPSRSSASWPPRTAAAPGTFSTRAPGPAEPSGGTALGEQRAASCCYLQEGGPLQRQPPDSAKMADHVGDAVSRGRSSGARRRRSSR